MGLIPDAFHTEKIGRDDWIRTSDPLIRGIGEEIPDRAPALKPPSLHPDAARLREVDDVRLQLEEGLPEATTALGAVQGQVGTLDNRLSYATNLAQSQIVNTRAAESRIRDANIAEESANLTRFNILNQSGLAALAQANQSTSAVLSLLR